MKTSAVLQPVQSPVSQAIILVCEKCGQKLALASGDALNPATEFQKSMKLEIKERFGKGVVRAVASSCLDICPENRVAISVANVHASSSAIECFTVAPEELPTAQVELLARYGK